MKCLLIFISCQQIYCEVVNNGGLPREPYQFKVAYDKLVIASGSEPLTFGIKGVKEKCFFPTQSEPCSRNKEETSPYSDAFSRNKENASHLYVIHIFYSEFSLFSPLIHF